VEAINPLLLFLLVPIFNKFAFPMVERMIGRKFMRLHKMLSGMFILIIVNIMIYTVQETIDQKFTYISPEDNDDSPMNHTSLVYQINYLNNGHYSKVFQDPKIAQAVHAQELDWNFRNYDSPKYGNAAVMPSNIFAQNGVASKRVWAKNDKKYFSTAVKSKLTKEEQLVDSTTPFIDFSIYHKAAERLARENKNSNLEDDLKDEENFAKKISLTDHTFLVRNDREIENFTQQNDIKSTLDHVYLKNARFNKFIMFENGQFHRIFQDEKREKNGQSRVDVYSLNENFIEEFTNLENSDVYSGEKFNGYNFVCRNDLLAGDIGKNIEDAFDVNFPGKDATMVPSKIALPNYSSSWKIPFHKKQVVPSSDGNQLHLWSFVIPQKSKCYFTRSFCSDKRSQATKLPLDETTFEDPICVQSLSSNILDQIVLNPNRECLNKVEPITVGVRAIYSVIDYSNGKDNKMAKLNFLNEKEERTSQISLNSDFNEVTVPLFTMIILYIILTAVEILISISGLAYSYEQAPDRLKAFISSLWLIPVALGNIIVTLLNHIEAFQVSVLDYFKFNVGFSIFVFILYIYVTMNYETKQEYLARKLEEEREEARREEYEMLKMKNMV